VDANYIIKIIDQMTTCDALDRSQLDGITMRQNCGFDEPMMSGSG
jgi:hypothetical protein